MASALRPLRLPGFPNLSLAYFVNELGNWLGEIALNYTPERRFRLILQIVLTLLGLRLLWAAARGAGWF